MSVQPAQKPRLRVLVYGNLQKRMAMRALVYVTRSVLEYCYTTHACSGYGISDQLDLYMRSFISVRQISIDEPTTLFFIQNLLF